VGYLVHNAALVFGVVFLASALARFVVWAWRLLYDIGEGILHLALLILVVTLVGGTLSILQDAIFNSERNKK